MLLAIAVLPLWTPHWWEHNRNKLIVSVVLGPPGARRSTWSASPRALVHMGEDYVSFIVLLAGLFVISGGVLLRGDLVATPLVNIGLPRGRRRARLRWWAPPAPPCC